MYHPIYYSSQAKFQVPAAPPETPPPRSCMKAAARYAHIQLLRTATVTRTGEHGHEPGHKLNDVTYLHVGSYTSIPLVYIMYVIGPSPDIRYLRRGFQVGHGSGLAVLL